jgi:hypothetical protein
MSLITASSFHVRCPIPHPPGGVMGHFGTSPNPTTSPKTNSAPSKLTVQGQNDIQVIIRGDPACGHAGLNGVFV